MRAAFCLRWGDASLLFWWIRSHQDFGRNVNVMRQAVYFLVCSSESMLFVCLLHRPLGREPLGFSKRATRSYQPPRTRLCAFPTPRPGPRPRRRRASRGPRGPTAKGFLARDTPSTRHGGRGCRGRAVLVARVDAGPSDLAVWYIGTLGMKVHKLAKKILEARLELATFCV